MNTSDLDLSPVRVVDNHAHPLTRRQPATPHEFRAHFSEAHSPLLARDHVATALSYRWTLRQLSHVLELDATEEALLLARQAVPFGQYARDLMERAGLGCLLLDEGYPPPDQAYSRAEMEEMLGVRIRPILRIETLAQDLIVRHARPTSLIDDFEVQVGGARAAGYVALKSIAAYRTGLQIDDVPEREVQAAFASARAEAERAGAVRLRAKPLVDFFVLRALRLAAAQRLPVQFHTGYGDPDLDLRLADPLHLRPLFEDGALESVPIVLLHESYPFTANAAFLAAVYPNAYLDISYSLPPLGRSELRRVTALALDAAPASKIMVSSDGVSIPEHYLLGAVRAREVLADVLGLAVASGELGRAAAEETGRLILRDNAVRVYDLYSDVNQSPV